VRTSFFADRRRGPDLSAVVRPIAPAANRPTTSPAGIFNRSQPEQGATDEAARLVSPAGALPDFEAHAVSGVSATAALVRSNRAILAKVIAMDSVQF